MFGKFVIFQKLATLLGTSVSISHSESSKFSMNVGQYGNLSFGGGSSNFRGVLRRGPGPRVPKEMASFIQNMWSLQSPSRDMKENTDLKVGLY